MKITYRYVEDYPDYIITNYGDVISLKGKKPRILKQSFDNDGYLMVSLCKNGKRKSIKIHTLVGNAFVGKRTGDLTFDHIDICKTNNRADNIRLATKTEQNINQNMNIRNKTGERNISIVISGNYTCFHIKIKRKRKVVINKKLNIKKYTMDDAIKMRDEQLELLNKTTT